MLADSLYLTQRLSQGTIIMCGHCLGIWLRIRGSWVQMPAMATLKNDGYGDILKLVLEKCE